MTSNEEPIINNINNINKNINNNISNNIDIKNMDGLKYLSTIPNNSIDLILTDPPYIISRET